MSKILSRIWTLTKTWTRASGMKLELNLELGLAKKYVQAQCHGKHSNR